MTGEPQPATGTGPDPIVRRPRPAVPGFAIALIVTVAALLLFAVLNGQRQRRAVAAPASNGGSAFADPPPLVLPRLPDTAVERDDPLPPAPQPIVIVPPPAPAAPPPPPFTPQRSGMSIPMPTRQIAYVPPPPPAAPRDQKRGGAIVYDLGPKGTTTSPSRPPENGEDTPLKASIIASRTDLIPAGTQIPIVLETPIDTARPGLVRAIASDDTRGFDGNRTLIPRGSRFIGEYQGDIRSGQNRVLVTWSRVICPDGTTIRLASPAADRLGGAGVPGRVNSFFLQRFTGAVLQTALSFGANLAYRSRSNPVILGIPSSPVTSVGQGLLPTDYRPKITVKQGTVLNIFVARDLDFSGLVVDRP
ncbi:TrbI/VirB10 family protein [Sphingomonas sp. Leaf4]|uniref:TrbI/VirB10 family protein n=1 Tax=Sphingomonas sp. Leaf4 TaxID=2876553 RepID=UPI001E341E77|nr:TrbI/VirB10 family protein [Sphingomonas sp. Leaf4]